MIGGLTVPEVKLVANGENNPEGMAALNRSAELLLKLKIHELKGDRSQSEMIFLLDSLGFKSGEIIRLLGATAGTVRPILSRGRKKKKKG
jgi:DNA-directed RNA polymerase specialized sigma24 family protein